MSHAEDMTSPGYDSSKNSPEFQQALDRAFQTMTAEPITAGDKSKGPKYIADHAEEFGFRWGFGAIGTGVGPKYIELRPDCPWIDVAPELVPVFLTTFGGALISKGLRGQSIKVQCDRVNRGTLEKDRKVTNEDLRVKLVNSILLGTIIRTGGYAVTKYVVGGVAYTTAEAAKQAEGNNERIKQLEAAQAFLALAAEKGYDMTIARDMAKDAYPLAFVHLEEKAEEEEEDLNSEEQETKDEDDEARS